MNFFDAVILGIVEGFTEFLPISSTGHLILISHLLGIVQTEFVKTFEIFIQFGAISAVLVWARKKIFPLDILLWKKVVTAFIPTAVIGFVLYRLIKSFLIGNVLVVAVALIVGGIIIILFEKKLGVVDSVSLHEEIEVGKNVTYKQAFLVGVFQALAVIPGVSRSAATIIGGRLTGIKKQTIVEFSFLLAIPTVLAASAYDLLKTGVSLEQGEFGYLAVGFVTSFIVALLSIDILLTFVKKYSFTSFGIYRIVIGLIFLFSML